jgi:hypothetical protein
MAKRNAATAPAEATNEEVLAMNPDTNDIPTPASAPAITDRAVKEALEQGLPEMKKGRSEAYINLWNVYVRFIRQSPEKWNVEKDELLKKLEVLA